LGEKVEQIFPESKKFITSRGKTYSYTSGEKFKEAGKIF